MDRTLNSNYSRDEYGPICVDRPAFRVICLSAMRLARIQGLRVHGPGDADVVDYAATGERKEQSVTTGCDDTRRDDDI
jgi:hypothetical protein